MGKYNKGDQVKVEVVDEQFGDMSEWLWMSVDDSDDERQLVFGSLDNEPLVARDLKLGQQLVVSYDRIRDHRKSTDSRTIQ